MKLTAKAADSLQLPPGKTDYIVFDDDVSGLGLRIREGGSRTWIYQYRIGSKQRRMVLGNAKAVPLALARQNAGKLEAQVRLGGDPAAAKEDARREADNTFGVLVDQYLETRNGKWRARTDDNVKRHLLAYSKSLHRMPVTQITQRDIANLLNERAKASGDVSANRLRSSLRAFFGWVIREGVRLAEGNVVSATNVREEKSRERVLSMTELKTIWDACTDSDYGRVLKLLILTGQRAREIAELEWIEVNDEQIDLPPRRTKNKRAHTVPLSEPALAILTPLREDGRTHVFGPRSDAGFQSWAKAKAELDARLVSHNLQHWTVHDLRRSVTTHTVELGVQPHIIEAVLNHVSGHKSGVAGIYNRASYEREKRDALNLWAEHLMVTVEGRAQKIVQMRRV